MTIDEAGQDALPGDAPKDQDPQQGTADQRTAEPTGEPEAGGADPETSETQPALELEPELELASEPSPESDVDAAQEPQSEPEPGSESIAESEAEPEPEPESEPEPEPEPVGIPLHHPRAVALPDCLTEQRTFTVLPRLADDLDDGVLISVLEVLAQEDFLTAALHIADLGRLAELGDIFAERLTFGVHGVRSLDEHAAAVAAGAAFVLLITADEELVEAGITAGVCTLPAALTPLEVQHALRLPVPAVQVLPADLLGGNYAESLTVMIGHQPLLVRGGLGGWSAARWYAVGAIACGFDDALLSDAFTGGSLGQLRERCRSFRITVNEASAPITAD